LSNPWKGNISLRFYVFKKKQNWLTPQFLESSGNEGGLGGSNGSGHEGNNSWGPYDNSGGGKDPYEAKFIGLDLFVAVIGHKLLGRFFMVAAEFGYSVVKNALQQSSFNVKPVQRLLPQAELKEKAISNKKSQLGWFFIP
jgi:hypothetical protein